MSKILSEESLKKLVTSFVLSRLDYCNALYAGLPFAHCIDKLQKLQNYAARLILKKRKREHVTPLFIYLHWLPVNARIKYKTAVLTYKCLNGTSPKYLSDLTVQYQPSRTLRSGNKNLLKVNTSKCKLGSRAFSVNSPIVWNSLPNELRNKKTITSFKTSLKTYLFRSHFGIV